MRIGETELKNPYILAPMAGVTDLPFRLLCMEQGAGLLCMEMISAKALQYKNKNTKILLAVHPRNIRYLYSFLVQIQVLSARWRSVLRSFLFRFWILIWAVRCRRL